MKASGAAVQGGLALAGLVAAYVTWQRPREVARPDAVVLVAATRQSLERVRFDDGSRFVEVARRGGAGPRLWTTLGWLPGKQPPFDAGVPAPDGGAADARPPPGAPPTREVYASERAEALLARFTPLEAPRALGTLAEAKRDELGLTGSERHLEVTVAGQRRRLLASRAMPGLLGSYLEDEASGQVFLAPPGLLAELDPASEVLVDRRLHAFRAQEVDGLTLTVDGRSADFVQTFAEVPGTAKLARAQTPDVPDELARAWHERLWSRLVVTQVLGAGEPVKAGTPKVALRLDSLQRGAEKGFLELAVDPRGGFWARSENTAGWVAVHQGAAEVIEEARRLLPSRPTSR